MTCMTQDVLLTISGLHDMAFADPEENEENEEKQEETQTLAANDDNAFKD